MMNMQDALSTAARKARSDPREVVSHLDSISRKRALTDQESRELERAIKQLKRGKGDRFVWTAQNDRRLINLRAANVSFALIAETMGVSVKAAQNRFYKLNGAGA